MKFFKHFLTGFIIVMAFIFFSVMSCEAKSTEDIFFTANKQYDDGNFQEAIKLYENLTSQGIYSGNLYYNLGNAYYRTGKKGKALLNYERAKKLIPHNEDLFANISFIKSMLNIKQPDKVYHIYQKIWMDLRNAIPVKAWFFISVILFFTVCLLLGTGFLSYQFHGKYHIISGILTFLFIISLVFFINSYNASNHFKTGIIIIPETDIRYSPSYSGVVAFKLVDGMKAEIIRKEGKWSHIRLNKEKSGWIESEAIEAI